MAISPNDFGKVNTRKNVTTSDTVAIPISAVSLYVGGTGDVETVDYNGNTSKHEAVPVGTFLDVRGCKFIKATNTTATLMVLNYFVNPVELS